MACAVAAMILFIAQYAVPELLVTTLGAWDAETRILGVRASILLPGFQYLLIILATWFCAGLKGGVRQNILQLVPAKTGVLGNRVVISITLSLLFFISFVLRDVFAKPDIQNITAAGTVPPSLADLLIQAMVFIVLAPSAEELLFRGFLLSALQKTKLRFWGAGILVVSCWTALHYAQSDYAILTIFIAGLLFVWSLWVTGSLWSCIVCHSLFNAYAFGPYIIIMMLSRYATS